jgi:hypothetical protein
MDQRSKGRFDATKPEHWASLGPGPSPVTPHTPGAAGQGPAPVRDVAPGVRQALSATRLSERPAGSALRRASRAAKARIIFQSDNGPVPMVAIGIIALFLVVILGLNKFEFGRFD